MGNRSSGPKKGFILANSVGLIDADYYENPDNDGHFMFAFYNFYPFDITVRKGDNHYVKTKTERNDTS